MILIIDDSTSWAKTIAKMLLASGYETYLVDNGTDGIFCAIYGSFELIFVDFRLPDIDGVNVAIAIRQNSIETPIFLISGNIGSLPDNVGEANFAEIIGKPIMATDLIYLVNKHTGKDRRLPESYSIEDIEASEGFRDEPGGA